MDHRLLADALSSPSPLYLPAARLSELSPAVAAAAGPGADAGLLVVSASWGESGQPGLLVCLAGRREPFHARDVFLVRHVFG